MPSEITNLSNFQPTSPGVARSSPSARSPSRSESSATATTPGTRQILPGGNADTPLAATQPAGAGLEQVSAQELGQAVDSINAHIQNLQRSLQFSVDEELGRTIVKVLDSETEEVIRQIPTEEVLAIAHTIKEMSSESQAGGLFFQEQA